MTYEQLRVLQAVVAEGTFRGAMPEHLIGEELARGELVPIHVEGIEPRLSQLYQIRRTDKSIGIVASALWQALRDLSEELKRKTILSK